MCHVHTSSDLYFGMRVFHGPLELLGLCERLLILLPPVARLQKTRGVVMLPHVASVITDLASLSKIGTVFYIVTNPFER